MNSKDRFTCLKLSIPLKDTFVYISELRSVWRRRKSAVKSCSSWAAFFRILFFSTILPYLLLPVSSGYRHRLWAGGRDFSPGGAAPPARAAGAGLETRREAPRQAVEKRSDTRTLAPSLGSPILEARSWPYKCFLVIFFFFFFKWKIRFSISPVSSTFYFLQAVKTQHTQKDPSAVQLGARL